MRHDMRPAQFFCALDADDRLAPDLVRESASACSTSSRRSRSCRTGSRRSATSGGRGRPSDVICRRCSPATPSNGAALVRRDAFEAVGGYDEAMREGCEDWDFWLRLVEGGRSGAIVPEVLFYYRRRADSMSR